MNTITKHEGVKIPNRPGECTSGSLAESVSRLRTMLPPSGTLFSLLLAEGILSGCALSVAPGARRVGGVVMEASAEASAPTLEFGDKRAERRRIMNEKRYMRGARPFDKDVHEDVLEKMSETFKSELVEQMKDSTFREVSSGEGNSKVTFVLAEVLVCLASPVWLHQFDLLASVAQESHRDATRARLRCLQPRPCDGSS